METEDVENRGWEQYHAEIELLFRHRSESELSQSSEQRHEEPVLQVDVCGLPGSPSDSEGGVLGEWYRDYARRLL